MRPLKETLQSWGHGDEDAYTYWIAKGAQESHTLELLVQFAFEGSKAERMHACWILHHISDRNPAALQPYEGVMVKQLKRVETESEQRFVLRYFSKHRMPEEEDAESFLLDYCFELLHRAEGGAAPRVYAMTVLHHLAVKYPDLASELKDSIELANEHGTAGMKNRGNKVIADLEKRGLV